MQQGYASIIHQVLHQTVWTW